MVAVAGRVTIVGVIYDRKLLAHAPADDSWLQALIALTTQGRPAGRQSRLSPGKPWRRMSATGTTMKFPKDLKAANVAGMNPFKPTAGANPPQLVGRAALIDEFAESIENGPGAPGRLTIFSGPRGVGKTVMLNAVAEQVQADHQWLVINETATPGFLDRLSRSAGRMLDPEPSRRRLTNVILPVIGGGVGFSNPAEETVTTDFRQVISLLLDQCDAHRTGVLITLDEVHSTGRQELGQFAAAVQHLIREEREVAVALAGLPAAVNELLNDTLTTFLRRADRTTSATSRSTRRPPRSKPRSPTTAAPSSPGPSPSSRGPPAATRT